MEARGRLESKSAEALTLHIVPIPVPRVLGHAQDLPLRRGWVSQPCVHTSDTNTDCRRSIVQNSTIIQNVAQYAGFIATA